ncbi:hypothetical protein [Rhizobium sp. BK456]|uniref:hypothetical protein n=1 Tax=Rhizobium sp. BK456 TaxID=2587007 RepID=UPI00160C75A0|nr:hypothetical protein [Rhizobium sp. BK456]MBB3520960.1 hypothetical protein [Rhizobium sp. BK456]
MKNLPKATLRANLLALAEESDRDQYAHRARFQQLVEWTRSAIEGLATPDELCTSAAPGFFRDAVHIAKRILRMEKAEFESAVAVLNTRISRVVDDCPSGKDTRDLPYEWLRMRPDELHMTYSLMTPYDAAEFIADRGALAGYGPEEIAKARAEYRVLDKARQMKRGEEDKQRAIAERARLAARVKSGYTVTTYRA